MVRGAIRLEKLPLAGKGLFVGLVQLFSAETGELLAIMPDGLIQQTRVGVTGASVDESHGTQSPEDPGLIGSGGQLGARYYRYMTGSCRSKTQSVPSGLRRAPKSVCRGNGGGDRHSGKAVASAEATAGCDVICSATKSFTPVVQMDWLKRGMHYNSIREFETDLMVLEKCDVIAIHTNFGGIQHYQPPGIGGGMPSVARKPRLDEVSRRSAM